MRYLLMLVLISSIISAQENILIDEDFSDWENIVENYTDPIGDNNGYLDFHNMSVSSDTEYLYLRIQTTEELILVNNNLITLYIDADNDPLTGKKIGDLGAELEYFLGERYGNIFLPDEVKIDHSDLSFFGAPTFSSNEFEFAIRKNSEIDGQNIFSSDTISIKFIAYTDSSLTTSFDMAPDDSGFEYIFPSLKNLAYPVYSITKREDQYLRVMSYNIERDGILEIENTPEFNHIFNALKPEIIGFTEVYEGSSQNVADKVEFFLPSQAEDKWYHKKEGEYDIVLLSRYQILKSFTIHSEESHNATGAFLLNMRPRFDTEMLVIVAHPKCCGGKEEDAKRQNQFDAIIAFVRDAVMSGGVLNINKNIPIIIMGDMNLVGDSRQYTTLITGDIKFNDKYGEDFIPDWDGTFLDDAKPFVSNTGFTYTTNPKWFPPGRLDFITYSGSVMKAVNSFIFDTAKLNDDQLNRHGLSKEDTKVSDHLPVVVDFQLDR